MIHLAVLLLLLPASEGFVLARQGRVSARPLPPLSASSQQPLVGGGSEDPLNLPPGRRTPRFVSFLFDDSLRLLNPKTMATYQVKRREEYGDVFKTNIFGKPTVFVTSKEALAELGKQEATHDLRAFFPPHHQTLFGQQSLLVQSGDTHSRLRRLIQPSLSPTVMKTVYEPIINDAMTTFLQDLPRSTDYFKVVPHIRSFFISIALQILLGKASDVPAGLAEDLTLWSKGLLAAPLTKIPWSTAAKAMRARKRICSTMAPLLEQARQDPNDNSLLGRLVTSTDDEGNTLSDQDILDNVLTLVFAGSDTTASAATSMWKVLSLSDDFKEGLKNNPSQIDGFVQQVLESYPPAPFQMRLTKDQLSVGGYDIPAGWTVIYGFAGALLGDDTTKEKLEEMEGANPSGSAAFGTGPRMCPGRYLAALELKILCEKLIDLNWELKKDQNLVQTYTPGYFPKDGLQIRVGWMFG